MVLYSCLICIAWLIIIAINYFIFVPIFNFGMVYIILSVVLSTMAIIAIDGLTAGIVRLLPKKLFNPFAKRFKVFKWEKSFYQKLGIKKWKDLVPELGHLTGFRKNKIKDPSNNKYIERYLLEATYGRVGHFLSFFTGFLIIFIFPLEQALCFAVPVAVVNVFLNLLSLLILRYNTPKLIAIYKRNLKKII